jgi:type II secretory pathway pseudopilin PulG
VELVVVVVVVVVVLAAIAPYFPGASPLSPGASLGNGHFQ